MIHDLKILSPGSEDLASQALDAMQGPAMAELIRHRVGHFQRGHDREADDAVTYRQMMQTISRDHLQPMFDRTDGNPSAVELRCAATAALKLAARCLAFADKAHRHAARIEAAEQEEASE